MAEENSIVTRKGEDSDVRYSYRCHTCSIEFPMIEDLLTHVSQSHTNSDGRIECGECQDCFSNTEEYIEHYRTNHDTNHEEYKNDLGLTHSDIENSSELPNQITILNEDGEAVGLTASNDRDDANLLVGQSGRKRRPSAKIREILQNDSPAKKGRSFFRQPPSFPSIAGKSNEVEIDVSEITSVRLKTKSNDRSEEVLQYLQRVEEKLDCILKHFNVPLHGISSTSSVESGRNYKNSPKQQNRPSMVSSLPNIRSQVIPIRAPLVQEPNQQEITQYVISDDLLEATFIKSRNRGNFAKNLVYAAFPLDERLGRNCNGRRGGSLSGPKEPLEAAKLDAVREAVFLKYPVTHEDEEEGVWKRECVIAIDTALRSEMRQRILALNSNSDIKET